MSNNPYQSNYPSNLQASPGPQAGVSIMQPLIDASGWVKLMAWIFIIGGVLYCLTIVGIIFGWLPIWLGITLKRAGDNLSQARQINDPNLMFAVSKDLGLYFTISGVLFLVGMVLTGLWMAFVIVISVFGAVGAAAA